MSRTAVATGALALLIVLAGCGAYAPTATDVDEDDDRIGAGPTSPEDFSDPPEDVLGWEDGYWYDEPLAIDASDGLDEDELSAVVSRSIARVEHLRGLEFKERPPVEVISRDEFRSQRRNQTVPDEHRQFANVKYEALFMIDGSTDAIEVQRQNQEGAVLGYYSPTENRIVLISDDGAVRVDEVILAHELLHALQDQHFGLTGHDRQTRDERNALDGLVEGDARYVEHLYRDRCGEEWDCVDNTRDGERSELADIGPYLLNYQPYSDGPAFVRHLYRQGGWSEVNEAYDDPPVSTGQVIHPERYPDVEPVRPQVDDRTRGSWERISVENRPNYTKLGEVGANAMLVYPGYDSNGRTQVVPLDHFLNTENGDVNRFDPLNYAHPYTDGLRGDRLVPYRNAADQTGYVWVFVFEDGSEATEFREGYEAVLDYRNATVVDERGATTTYRIDDDPSGFGSAIRVTQDDDRIVITNAPTVQQLDSVRSSPGEPATSDEPLPAGALSTTVGAPSRSVA